MISWQFFIVLEVWGGKIEILQFRDDKTIEILQCHHGYDQTTNSAVIVADHSKTINNLFPSENIMKT